MIYGYTKLFGSIVTSTIWLEDPPTCKVWVTLMALADMNGEVQASIPGLANLCTLPVEIVEKALNKFLATDKYSRTPDFEGRRIEEIEGGWRLLNHAKYREKMSDAERKERDRLRKQEYRERLKKECPMEGGTKQDKTGQLGKVREIQQADTNAEALKTISSKAVAPDEPDLSKLLQDVWDYYINKVERNPKIYSFTPLRKRKGLLRLRECLSKTNGDAVKAVELMKIAVDNLASSDWHMGRNPKTGGERYCEWEDHLFSSHEQMEKWWNYEKG